MQAQQLQIAKWREFHPNADLVIHSFQKSSLPRERVNEEVAKVLAVPKGDGLWAWKALCISHVFDNAREGDIVFYMDSGAHPTENLDWLFSEIMTHGHLFVRVPGFDEEEITRRWLLTVPAYAHKRSLIEQPNLFHASKWDKRGLVYPPGVVQVCGGFQGYVVCERSRQFLHELRSMITLTNYDDATNIQHSAYIDHRHDQSVLTEMVLRHDMHIVDTLPGILLHRAN